MMNQKQDFLGILIQNSPCSDTPQTRKEFLHALQFLKDCGFRSIYELLTALLIESVVSTSIREVVPEQTATNEIVKAVKVAPADYRNIDEGVRRCQASLDELNRSMFEELRKLINTNQLRDRPVISFKVNVDYYHNEDCLPSVEPGVHEYAIKFTVLSTTK